jgi:tripartite-type tricarboxylate transporter receptor subunit TctC
MKARQWSAALLMAAIAWLPAVGQGADASYPSKPVKVVVGFSAGSATDVAARAISEVMARRLGQPFVVDNKPGAASEIAAKAVVTSPPDGYTIFIATIANVINRGFPNSTSTDLVKDMIPVTMIGSVPNVLVVNPSLGVSSVADLIRLAKAKPGEITFASSGNGTSPHLSAELFSSMAGVKVTHVPYKGSAPAVTDVLAGHVQVMFST